MLGFDLFGCGAYWGCRVEVRMHGERRHESCKLGSSAVPVIAHDDGYSFDSSYLCCILAQRLMLLHVY